MVNFSKLLVNFRDQSCRKYINIVNNETCEIYQTTRYFLSRLLIFLSSKNAISRLGDSIWFSDILYLINTVGQKRITLSILNLLRCCLRIDHYSSVQKKNSNRNNFDSQVSIKENLILCIIFNRCKSKNKLANKLH